VAALGTKTRLSTIRLVIALIALAILLTMLKGAYHPRTFRFDILLEAVGTADRNETALKTHAQRSISPAILKAALSDRRLSNLRKLRDARNPQAELQKMASANVGWVEGGMFRVYAESDSEDEAIAVAQAVADAYVKDQGPIGIVKQDDGISSCTASTLDVPWKVAVAAILAFLASASILFVPLRWLSPARLTRPVTAGFRSSPRRFLFRGLLVLVAIPPILLALSMLGLFPWSGINCWQNDIDISRGRIRQSRYLLWIPVQRSVWDSALTRAVPPTAATGSRPDWHAVVTLSPGLHHSPHYVFHGAIHQIRELELCWEFGNMTPEAREETARHLLRLWQQNLNYFQATDYLQAVWERARDAKKNGETIDVSDLPVP
jgi:hypothetical protein